MPKRHYTHKHYHYTAEERRAMEERSERAKNKSGNIIMRIFSIIFFIIPSALYLLLVIVSIIYFGMAYFSDSLFSPVLIITAIIGLFVGILLFKSTKS